LSWWAHKRRVHPPTSIYALLEQHFPSLRRPSTKKALRRLLTDVTVFLIKAFFSLALALFSIINEIDFIPYEAWRGVEAKKGFPSLLCKLPSSAMKAPQPSARLPHRLEQQFLVLNLSRAFSQFKCLLSATNGGGGREREGNCAKRSQQG
jgi:hypothetical protein